MDTKLQVLPELLVELLVILLVLGNLLEHLERLLDDVLLDHLEDLVLLKVLARDAPRARRQATRLVYDSQLVDNDCHASESGSQLHHW